ncbi:MAG: glycosyl hydrolase 115 family protein [Lachnospiraceae bacterium]|nr:glycosyl hydrolase 115 family protein [Lachnospiraceae bacterium]
MRLSDSGKKTAIFIENDAFEGVKRVAVKVAADVEKVTGCKPAIVNSLEGLDRESTQLIFCATVGKSELLPALAEQGLSVSAVEGKREVYEIKRLSDAESFAEMLVIYGSDKRGTIYGMFGLSEYMGVTPLCYWGDVEPVKKADFVIDKDIEVISKEPSIRYRGFFINDEWPCCGNWATKHFGDFNADMYEHVFEFLLRMKGNYLWPAMWSASFPLDGPGSKNEELADIYGVVMGYSHHEPCLRASEEWDKVRGPETEYGNEWNFYTNEKGLMNYWRDALKRSGKYENLITIGMRGERDSSMLGENATVEENVKLLMDIIRKQRQLIRENVNENIEEVPQLLALYKEVEAYFYGDENIKGLKDWDELDGVICMLCEDNFGHMRTLPTEEMRGRKGGFGMYYHFDYHGGPISYEWVDSTPMSKTWEQMCMAYEYGIQDAWIVNVGDLKFHEVPLTYFMALAYDYEKWGYGNKNSYREYTMFWAEKNFAGVSEELQEAIGKVLTDYIDMNHLRRPESLNPGIYHACENLEADKMLAKAETLEGLSRKVYEALNGSDKEAYYSMIHFSAMASMNLIKMHLYAAKNALYARQGKTIANKYGELVRECIKKDRAYYDEFGAFKNGKWDGMQMAQHIGFTKWNEDDCRYPVIMSVEPAYKPRLKVNRKDSPWTAGKNYGAPMAIKADDFRYMGCEQVIIEIANDGVGSLHYVVEPQTADASLPAWLKVSAMEGEVQLQEELVLTCDRSKLSGEEQVRLLIKDEETTVAVDVSARSIETEGLPEKTYLEKKGIIAMNAGNFFEKKDTLKGGFEVLEGYGKYGTGVKVFPSTAVFAMEEEKPFLYYRCLIEEAGEYEAQLVTAPTNSVVNKQSVNVALQINGGEQQKVELVPANFRAGESSDPRWGMGVLNQERRVSVQVTLAEGINTLGIGALEAGVVLERVILYSKKVKKPENYMGPEDSYVV